VRTFLAEQKPADRNSQDSRRSETSVLCGLTLELSGRRRQDARARAEKMYTVPQAGPWRPAVGAPLERVVRRRFALGTLDENLDGYLAEAVARKTDPTAIDPCPGATRAQ
jgi:hypothetical protein